ncbi:MFS transporter [Nocardia sp. NPDC127579]|uniref:MFS transporter n=1 Tax=Nocardia sp. NPDC127579 TaxID=3345402 RepID=UPI00363F799F
MRAARCSAAAAFAIQGFFLAVILTELPQQKSEFGLSDGLLAGSVAAISLIAGLGSVLAERIAMRWSSALALRIGLFAIAITGAGLALAPDATWLIALLCVYGLGIGMVDAGANMQAVLVQREYGRFILSSFYAAWSAGSILGALFVSVCAAVDVALSTVILVASAVVAASALVASRRLLDAAGRDRPPSSVHLPTPIPGRVLLGLGAVLGLAFGIDLAVGNWSALYLTDELLSSPATAALALAAYQCAALFSRLTGDPWVRRFGPRAVARAAATMGAAGLATVVFAAQPAVAIAGFVLAGVGSALLAPLCFGEIGSPAAGPDLEAAVARLNIFNYAGTLLGGGVVGVVAAVAGMRAGFVVPFVFALTLFGLARTFPARILPESTNLPC